MSYSDEVADIATAFEYETCCECGNDLDKHAISPDPLGHAHAWCLQPLPDDEQPAGGQLWIEYTDGGARWGNAGDDQQNKILAFAVSLLGQPDTTV